MNTEQVKKLFPLKAVITQNIIDSADVWNVEKCKGALTLKSVLPDELKDNVTWGANDGFIFERESKGSEEVQMIRIATEEGVNMIYIEEPLEVTFIIKEQE